MAPTTGSEVRSTEEGRREQFEARAARQAQRLKEELSQGSYTSSAMTLGIELEGNVVDESGDVVPVPELLFETGPFQTESAAHTIEINSDPKPFTSNGYKRHSKQVEEKIAETRAELNQHGLRLVLNGTWLRSQGDAVDYLTAHEEEGDLVYATHLRDDPRYYRIDNGVLQAGGGVSHLDVPGIDRTFPSMLYECLGVTFQPHLLVPDPSQFPAYHNTAIRTMAPILALATNVPFLPPELYNEVKAPHRLVDRTYHELRVPVTEQAVNIPDHPKKARVPKDINSIEEIIDRIADERIYIPPPIDQLDDGGEGIAEFRLKRQSFWRWVRPVFGGGAVDNACTEQAVRLEYRPVSTQPHWQDIADLQALISGALYGLVEQDHPVTILDWHVARENFDAVVESGIHAEMSWITANGSRTTDTDRIYEDLFDAAEWGLRQRGFSVVDISKRLEPLKRRWRTHKTPSIWKKQQVSDALSTGCSLETAIYEMHHRYRANQTENDRFIEWME
jgi:hypothetical protein